MSFTKTPTETYDNGTSLLKQFTRVYSDGSTIRPATESELEHGVVSRTVLPNDQASVYLTYSQGRYPFVANGSISTGSIVYRAADGKVSASGSSELGIASSDTSSDGEVVYVETSKSGGGGGGGGTLLSVDVLPQSPAANQIVHLEIGDPTVDGVFHWDAVESNWRRISHCGDINSTIEPLIFPNLASDYTAYTSYLTQLEGQLGAIAPSPQINERYVANAPLGDDSNDGLTPSTPFETRTKALLEIAALGGNVRVNFNGGDTWIDNSDFAVMHPNVTISSFGTGKATFSAFNVSYPSGMGTWIQAGATNRYSVTEILDIAGFAEVGSELTNPFIQVSSTAEVESTTRSWFYDGADLHINVGGDPNLNSYVAIQSNVNNGIKLTKTGCRAENIITLGFGVSRTIDSTGAAGFSSNVTASSVNMFVNCESYYGGDACFQHFSATGSGGRTLFKDCVGGFMRFNSTGTEQIFKSHMEFGGQETTLIDCTFAAGTLKNSGWGYVSLRVRGIGLRSSSGAGASYGRQIVHGCTLTGASSTPAKLIADLQEGTVFAKDALDECTSIISNCTHERTGGVLGDDCEIPMPAYGIVYASTFDMIRADVTVTSLSGVSPTDTYYVNSYVLFDMSQVGNTTHGIWNDIGPPDIIYMYHTAIKTVNGVMTTNNRFGLDWSVKFLTTAPGTGNASGSYSVNSVVSAEQSGSTNLWFGLNNNVAQQHHNGVFGLTSNATQCRSHGTDPDFVNMPVPYNFISPDSSLSQQGSNSDLPRLSHDINGKVRTVATPDIGPVDISS